MTASSKRAPQPSERPPGPRTRAATAETGGFLHGLGQVFGRSLFPFVALTLIAGTMLWGPWGTLVLALVWWNVVTRIG
jgi:hypothetical protein